MRRLAIEVEEGRARAVEGERLAAFRESARRFAHELRNPLTPIRLAVARLQKEAPKELAEVIEVLDSESQRLERMSRSFAQFGRLPEGPLSDVDLAELVRYAARAALPREVPVEIETPAQGAIVRGQHDALQRAVENLLRNAAEASAPGAKIRIVVEPVRVNAAQGLAVTVYDNGCGIPADRIERIWEPYFTSKAGGTGLGLAIVRQAVEAHGGRVYASSAPGIGTRIGFVLPVSAATVEPDVG
jgi:signal transduction histidine kinase